MENYVNVDTGVKYDLCPVVITNKANAWVDPVTGQVWFSLTQGESNIPPLRGDPTEKEVEKKLANAKKAIGELYDQYRPWYDYEPVEEFLVGRVALEVLEPIILALDMDCPPDWPEDF